MATIRSLAGPLELLLDPARLCQAFFVLSAAAVLAVAATPPSARGLLTQYGARNSTPTKNGGAQTEAEVDRFTRFIGWATSIGHVPHSWFMHFYVLSVSSSIFWAQQYAYSGTILESLAKVQTAQSSAPSMTLHQVQLTWLLMALQGARRLYECMFVMPASSSKMWIVHWLLGCAYYLIMGISVWIEGSSESKRYRLALSDRIYVVQVPFYNPIDYPLICSQSLPRSWLGCRFSCWRGQCNILVTSTWRDSKNTLSPKQACSNTWSVHIIRVNAYFTSH